MMRDNEISKKQKISDFSAKQHEDRLKHVKNHLNLHSIHICIEKACLTCLLGSKNVTNKYLHSIRNFLDNEIVYLLMFSGNFF